MLPRARTFLKKYQLSAVGLTFVLSSTVILLAILAVGAVQQGLLEGEFSKISLDMPLLIDSVFAAGEKGHTTLQAAMWGLHVPVLTAAPPV